jgi:tight adherence protein B
MSANLSDLGVFLIAAIGALFVVALVLLFSSGRGSKQRTRRITRVVGASEGEAKSKTRAISINRNQAYSSVQAIDALIRRFLPNPAKLRRRLARTGLKISLGQYLGASVVLGLLATLFLRFFSPLPPMAAPLVGVFFAIGVPHFAIGFLVTKRSKKFTELFPQAIDLIVRGLKSGLPVTESMRTVATELPDPVGTEFNLISEEIRFGQTLNEALWAADQRIDLPEFRFFIIALSIQQETGGNLAETLENLSTVLRRRRQMKLKIKAFSSEAKASAYIIGSLPFAMFGIILVINPRYALMLFDDPRGLFMVGLGLLCYVIGIGVMVKMVRFEI